MMRRQKLRGHCEKRMLTHSGMTIRATLLNGETGKARNNLTRTSLNVLVLLVNQARSDEVSLDLVAKQSTKLGQQL